MSQFLRSVVAVILVAFSFTCASPGPENPPVVSRDYQDLVKLFQEFRDLLKPEVREGVPDYGAAAMEAQRRKLKELQQRLAAIDPADWPVPQRADYLLVRAELNGLDFQHRVIKPWARDPGFYLLDQAIGTFDDLYDAFTGGRVSDAVTVEVPKLPLAPDVIGEFHTRLKAIPVILERAKENLTEAAGDLAQVAIRGDQSLLDYLSQDLTAKLSRHHPDLVPDAEKARAAIEAFREWLKQNVKRMNARAGVGVENYNWFLRNVALMPYTLEEIRVIADREYERGIAFLRIEENRNRKLPQLKPIMTEADYRRAVDEANAHIMKLIAEQEMMTIPEDYVAGKPDLLWAIRPGPFERPGGQRNFFQTTEDHDPRPLQSHITVPGHHLDGYFQTRNSHPIRGVRRLFGIDSSRSNWAFYVEELLLQAGLYEKLPRSREIVYIMQAMRAARAPAELMMHANEGTYEDALRYMAQKAPRWLYEDDTDLVNELGGYLRRPGAGVGYLMGKVEIEKYLADRSNQLGDSFTLRQFHDEFLAAGRIPLALMRWEATGLDDQVKKLW